MNTTQIGVIGAGELGQALGHVLEKAGSQVLYYDQRDEHTTTASISDVVDACQLLLICVPSNANREVLREIAKHTKPDNPPLVLSLSKGVEGGFKTMDQVLAETLPKGTPYGLIYGPMLASELIAHTMVTGVMTLSDPEYAAPVREMFARARVFLELSSDIRGVAVSGVLRNPYAMAFGMSDGLDLGANARGRMAVMILREMKRIMKDVGAKPETAEGLAGLGDLLAAVSGNSFNYRLGRSIAEGIADGKVNTEGLNALKELPHIIKLEEYPLMHLMHKMIYEYEDPHALQQFLES
ncbi:MAG TPA: NAD(P)-binding domain-containing protein [Candidatus Saccharimonadales bacterium]|nr:NAD(P)-binding domain-containing protein [Candidatus Saccharimonadales bacterium]